MIDVSVRSNIELFNLALNASVLQDNLCDYLAVFCIVESVLWGKILKTKKAYANRPNARPGSR